MPEPDGLIIRSLGDDDITAAIDVLADAFLEFPALQVMVGTGTGARERLARVFAMEFEPESGMSALVAELDGRIVGALTYADSPRCSAMSAGRMIRFARIAGPRIFTAMRLFGRIERAHPESHHRHLPSVGVCPGLQGRGIGRALMQEFDHRCDDDRIEAYLETIRWVDPTRPSHERFYGQLGYAVGEVISMTGSWSVLTMTREPGAAPLV